ncbi:MAG: 3'(2'),5'-bisphosphate nucleotidase CysQ [Pyrinomonadaceae bacterium]|nr:3'(2'),5'-bisphosphate nucleotidase CysQ [Pyrinomonadaceae bacterium]
MIEEAAEGEAYERELRVARELARAAGAAALQFYGGPLHIEHKGEVDEPVTQADHAANDLIVRGLREAFPDDGLLSEETVDTARRLTKRRVWMVDPLDGTKGFIDGDGDFSVHIGLAVEGASALGVVYQPVTDVLYWGADERGAWVVRPEVGAERLRVSDEVEPARMRLAASRSHRGPRMEQVVKYLGLRDEVRRGSVGIKVGLIVERQCDLYVHLSPRTKQWDTCAPEAILREAGGKFTDLFGFPLNYNSLDVCNRNGIAASNGVAHSMIVGRLAPLLAEFGRARV